jgi:N6-adenosine-specific RNA methylase IME4
MQVPDKIGKVEELVLVPADKFSDVPIGELASWINQGHAAIKMAVRRLAIHVAQVGGWLVAAKAKCEHGEWLDWLKENCPEISERTGRKYIELYNKAVSNRHLNADLRNMTPHQAYRALGIVKDPFDHAPVETPPLPDGKYNVIYADPPWQYDNTGLGGAAEKHYPTMSIGEICRLPISELTGDKAVLFLWVTSPFLKEGFQVCEAWEFDYKTSFVWIKDRATYGKLGFYTYSQHEFLLVATKGSCLPKEGSLQPSLIIAKKDKHSKKPEVVYGMIEQMYNPPYIELFARQKRMGWDVWGFEA